MTNIGEIVETVPSINPFMKNKEVDTLFTENPKIQGIVVVHEQKPIAHITRANFYQKIGTLYGYNLYMGRENNLISKNTPLIVDYFQPITEVSMLAMQRQEEDLYDDVIVNKNGLFIGIVSIRALLMKLVEIQVETASFLNPLSKLPGNHLIDDKLVEMLNLDTYSLLYFDLDHFKAYNDMYGFNIGDKVLLHITDILKKNLLQLGHFLGHIGGDDFLAILPHYEVKSICEKIIEEFDESISRFYHPDHLAQPAFQIKNRSGQMETFSIVSLSIAVVTNQSRQFEKIEELSNFVAAVKRNCKKNKGSCYIINEY